ncbi:MAG: 30S ribosomal protein S20 [Clostridia bacterium]|nr:30S ribosomal protein S20 [Clostridia bacterium]MBR2883536.1 30S ribosomal protein S20 [Clostridia bacterium]
MPNIKSAKKRVLVIEKKTLENRMVKSAIRTELRKFDAAVTEGNKATAQELYNICVKKLDQAASKGVYHKNTVSRKKSQLAKAFAALA